MKDAPSTILQQRWIASTLACAIFALVASSLAMNAGQLQSDLLPTASYPFFMLLAHWLTRRQPGFLPSDDVQSAIIFVAGLVPFVLLVLGNREEDYVPVHALLLGGLRNMVCVAGVFAATRRQRRRCVLFGLMAVVFAFAMSGSLGVIAASLGYLLALTYWLACNDAERWSPGLPAREGLRLARAAAMPATVVVIGLAVAVLFYPEELGWVKSPLGDFAQESGELTAEEIRKRAIEREEDIEEVANRTLGAEAAGSGENQSDQEAEDLQGDLPHFSTIRLPNAAAPAESRQVLRVDGVSASHLPAMTYDRFDGQNWFPEISAAQSFLSYQLAKNDLVRKEVSLQALELGKRALSSGASAEDFLEQARSAVNDWLSGASGDALEASYSDLERIEQMQLYGGFRLRGVDPDHLMTQYDLQAIADDVLLSEEKREQLLKLLMSGNSEDPQARASLVSELFRARRRQGGILPPELLALVGSWVSGTPAGSYERVDALVEGLRDWCEHDPSVTPPPGVKDTVKHFLLESRRGPDYLFASSAVVLLRGIGYPARMVSGFVARPERYNHFSGQTGVYEDDLHYWAQVRVRTGKWIDIEPTPGYALQSEVPEPPSLLVAASQAVGLDRPVVQVVLGGALSFVFLAYLLRRRVALFMASLVLRSRRRLGSAEAYVRSANHLLDHRVAVARRPRPTHVTTGAWVASLVDTDAEVAPVVAKFRLVADRASFAPQGLRGVDRAVIDEAVDQLLKTCTTRRLRCDARHRSVPAPHAPLRSS